MIRTSLAGVFLTLRRRATLVAGLATLAVFPVLSLVGSLYVLFFGQFVPMAIAVFSMARHGRGRTPLFGAAAGAAALLWVDLFVEELQTPGEIVFHWFAFALVWVVGTGLRISHERTAASTRRAIDAEVAAAEQAMAAVAEERTRIARELHDIVAHSVSTMVVQAGAAELAVGDDPDFARQALSNIRSTGASALGEMRRVVEILREPDEVGILSPQPGLSSIAELVDGVRSDGLEATLEISGDAHVLPAGVDLAAYRIVQEALTNVRRHAQAGSVRVSLAYGADDLSIEVVDDGRGGPGRTGGHGLVGMRERAALYGGRVDAGPGDSGFVVRAVLPAGATS